jgi:DNA-binding NtrC family response regulator
VSSISSALAADMVVHTKGRPVSISRMRAPAPRVLVVEDQPDVRRMVATALTIDGYRVDQAANAHDGLERLRSHHYALVVSDYAMPGGTGTWMIEEATRLGFMDETVALIVTAHPDVRPSRRLPVVRKPIDLDDFLAQVRETLPNTAPIDASAPASSARPRAKQKRT